MTDVVLKLTADQAEIIVSLAGWAIGQAPHIDREERAAVGELQRQVEAAVDLTNCLR